MDLIKNLLNMQMNANFFLVIILKISQNKIFIRKPSQYCLILLKAVN